MKNIIITGASGGIGSEIARTLAGHNTRLILIYNRHLRDADKLRDELSSRCEVSIFKCNLTDSKEISIVANQILNQYKTIDCLINCAGVSLSQQIQDITDPDYAFIMDNNFKSCVMMTKFISKNMITNKSGKIINISSIWGKVGASMESLYSASKGAINAFTLSLAKELGPSNITVNAVCPGLIDTSMNAEYSHKDLQDIIDSTPISRIGKPKDIANLVAFLCSDESDFITGQIITVDGGLTL
ncbi:MAG: SDR family oxidoreductase [Clostridia bacterium]|nr:SDR family oxidoreductase [Clostridia bacterium]